MPDFVWSILYILIGLIVGLAGGFFGARYVFKKQLKENPPINEKQIEAMLRTAGMTPSQKKIRQIMKSMEQSK